MATILSTKTSGVGGLTVTGDASGVLELASANGTTAVTIDASQNVVLAKGLTVGATAAPAFSAYQSVAQSIASLTFTKVIFQTKEFDTGSNFDSTTNYRFTPTVAGYYHVDSTVMLTGPINCQIYLYKNATAFKVGCASPLSSNMFACSNISTLIYLNGSTDYIEIYLYTGNATANNTNAGVHNTYFQAFLARSA